MHSAQKILITEAGSLLGFRLSQFFLDKNSDVFGSGKIAPPPAILKNSNFTLLDIDLSQPIPSQIPQFDLIIHLLHESTATLKNYQTPSNLTPATNNILNIASKGLSQVIFLAPILTNQAFCDYVGQKVKLFLVGDIYGPEDPLVKTTKNHPHTKLHHPEHFYYHNELNNLITQAITSDKIILEDEGQRVVTPTFVDDAIAAIKGHLEDTSAKSQVVVSQTPQTALTCAYKIQEVARITLNKEHQLFFAGPEKQIEAQPHPQINPVHLQFAPKTSLHDGLQKTFEYYKEGRPAPAQTVVAQTTHKASKPTAVPVSIPQETKYSQKNLLAKIPKPMLGVSTKRIVLALVVIILLFTLKTAFDLYIGVTQLKTAGNMLIAGDFKNAKNKANSAAKSLQSAQKKVKTLSWPISFIIPVKITAYNNTVASAHAGAVSISYFVEGAETLVGDLKGIAQKQSGKNTRDFSATITNFNQAYLQSSIAYSLASSAKNAGVFQSKLANALDSFDNLGKYSISSIELVNLVKEITTSEDKKTYLILLQNNLELRPGGGFIGTLGEIVFENGKLADIPITDIYAVDSQLKENIKPPEELTEKLGIRQLFLRDSNWSLDFASNSKTARDIYKKETGKDVDGVIALDLTLLQEILAKVSPIEIEGYSEPIDAQNLFERGEFYAKGKSAQKEFYPTVTKAILDKLVESVSNDAASAQIPWFELASLTRQSLVSKHLLLSFDSPNLSSLTREKGWDNPLPPAFYDVGSDSQGTRDFIALAEANVGANWVNEAIDRKIEYEVTVDTNSSLLANLKIVYKNNAQTNSWPAGSYVNFLRVYVPFGSTLSSFSNGESSNLKDAEVKQESNLSAFSTFVEVPPKQTREVIFTYKIPKNIKLEQAPSYNLYVSKQPGTGSDPLAYTFNLPQNIQIKSVNGDKQNQGKQNYKIESNLSQDRQFEIEVAKK